LTKCPLWCFADAQFVGAFDAADKVYFLLREIAIEQINCGKVCDIVSFYVYYVKNCGFFS